MLAGLLALLAAVGSLPAQDNRDPHKDNGESPTDLAASSGDWTHDAPGTKHQINLDVTGFGADASDVWGQPAGITVAADGNLLFRDDTGNTMWRVAYTGK